MWKWLSAAHRRIADREHDDEERLLNLAPELSDCEAARAQAHELSRSAERHRQIANRIEGRDHGNNPHSS